jgi:hypothetical protein
MSYLTADALNIDMSKVVISFWFRVPTEAANAVRTRTKGYFWDLRVFEGVIPLIAWGNQQMATISRFELYDSGAAESSSGGIIYLYTEAGGHQAPMQPSCIGLRVGSYGSPRNPPSLDVHIQTNTHASGTGLVMLQTSFTGTFVGINTGHGGQSYGYPLYANVQYQYTDFSSELTAIPEYLGNSDADATDTGAGHPHVTLDEWHHLLISWDLTKSPCKMWCAIDDKNKAGFEDSVNALPAMNDPTMGPNDHQSNLVFRYSGSDTPATASFSSDSVDSSPFQTPGPASVKRASDGQGGTELIAPIAQVELAELQIFSGMVLDTNVENNRRAFLALDERKDSDGNILSSTFKPADPGKAEDLMGTKPHILLHGVNNWQNGNNTGTTGKDEDGNKIPAGQFTPFGEIKKYIPDPSISL